MPKLNKGEHEFVSDLSSLPPATAPSPGPNREIPLPTLAAGGVLEIDARGLSAPLPLLRAHRALREMPPGQDLRVITSYKASIAEFQAMVKYVTNYELVLQDIVGEEYVHVLRKRR
jgi:tRNA 2-thiouridine synthesizing protein A